ncbi:hypothetical protein JXL21_02605 [Candidatus Bathyarchaeota archaeon]|nr:hypothetical protein [Candidatus Bathyarchaeota archaeon]
MEQEADTRLEQIIVEEKQLSDEKDRENLQLYPLPSSESNTINLTVINRCEFLITITGVWINATYMEVNENIPSMSCVSIGPYELVPREGGSYDIRVTTHRGNVFNSYVGVIKFSGGEWYSGLVGFRLIFPSKNLCYKMNPLSISIKESGDYIYEDEEVYWCISASEVFFDLGESGTYNLIIKSYGVTIFNEVHAINWPIGPAIQEFEFIIDGNMLVLG